MSETKVPAIQAPTASNVEQVARAVKSLLDVREGLIGDPLDANVTFRDLVDAGAVSLGPGYNGRAGSLILPVTAQQDGYDPSQDLTQPPAPSGFAATGLFASIQLQWDDPGYRNHSYAEVWRSDTNVIGNAQLIGTSATRFYVDNLGTGATRYYWVRFVSRANVQGPYHGTLGKSATTATDPALVLASLSGQITESQLSPTLASRISLVDAPSTEPNSVNARIAYVQGQINELLNIPAWTATARYSVNDQVTYGGSLYRALQPSTNVSPVNAAYWQKIGDYTTIGDAVAAHTTQINDLTSGLGQEVVDRTALAVQMRGNYTGNDLSLVSSGLIYQERQARATAVSSLSSEVTTLSALVNSKTKVYYQGTAPSGNLVVGDLWIDTNVTYYNDYASGDYAIRSNRQYRWNGTQWVEAMDYGFADWFSAINTEKTARVDADNALSTQITSLTSLANGNSASIQAEITARASADTALSSSISSLSSQLNNPLSGLPATRALLLSDYYTKTGTDSAISSASTTLTTAYQAADTATLNSAKTYVQSYSYSKSEADGAIATQISTLSATVNSNNSSLTAAIQTESTARANADNSLFAQYTVKTDLAGRVSGFGLASESNTAGSSTSAFAIIADRFSISAPNDYTQESEPTSGVIAGKVWYKPSTKQTFRYDGSAWVNFQPISPFVVQSTPGNAGGVAVPAGIYMDAAFIKDGTLTNAKIANAAVDNAKIANLDAGKINTGFLSADRIQGGSLDAKIANIDAAVITSGTIDTARIGVLTAGNINGYGLTVTGGSINGYAWPVAGQRGFYLGPYGLLLGNPNGGGNFFQYDQNTGNIYANGLTISGGTATFSGNLNAAGGTFSGTLNAAGGTFTGTLNVRSANSGARLEITNDVIKVYDGNGVLRVKIGNLSA